MNVKKKIEIEFLGRKKEEIITLFTFKPNKTMYHNYTIQTLQKQKGNALSLTVSNTRYSLILC